MPNSRYPFFEALIAPARPSATLPRLIAGSVIAVFGFFAFLYTASTLMRALSPSLSERIGTALGDGGTPAGVIGNLLILVFLLLSLGVALRQVHGRGLTSLFGPLPQALSQGRRVLLYLVGLHLAISLLMPAGPQMTPQPNIDPGLWLGLLPVAVAALLIQTGTEEIVFRGYLQSQLAAQFRTRVVWMLIPSVVFGILHYDPGMEGGHAWVIVGWAMAFGLVAADITARAGTLGPAIALHFINNFAAILLIAPQGNFDGLALYTFPFSLDDRGAIWVWAPIDLTVLLCSWLTARLAIRR